MFDQSQQFQMNANDKVLIISDLHIGNSGRRDDFRNNREMYIKILEENYLRKNYKIILNGDIEDLYKFNIHTIYKNNRQLYSVFDKFADNNNLIKLFGNHDYTLQTYHYPDINNHLYNSVRLEYPQGTIFIYHGHQVSNFLDDFNYLSYFLIKYLFSPLHIKNNTVSINDRKKFKTEIRAYRFSAEKKIISMIGHTHRPLFESLSKLDSVNMRIERLIRKYPSSDDERKKLFDDTIGRLRQELHELYLNHNSFNLRNGIYNDKLLVPCLFNSGCGIGRSGFTGIEIRNGKIALVYWFDKNLSKSYLEKDKVKVKQLIGSDYYKAILKSEPIDYVFNRIKLLA